MTHTAKEYRIRAMYLVNAGTNRNTSSNIIAKLDSRGGAAVMGGNGVGKTTTLHMMTLAFAVTSTQLMAGAGRKDSVIPFMLPDASSAIVFEYQRGSSHESDIRTVVVRRREDEPNVPFYRIYKSSFKKELFVKDGRFTDDISAQEIAAELGIQSTQKLTTAEYRHVFLRSRTTGKEKRKLLPLQADYSFGPKSLDNLDLIISAMLKARIEFEDIVQIIVDLVQNTMGMSAETSKLSASLNKAEVEKVRRNVNAVKAAEALAPRITGLNEHIKTYASERTMFESLSTAVVALKGTKVLKLAAGRSITGTLMENRELFSQEASKQQRLAFEALTKVQGEASRANEALAAAEKRRDYFAQENASAWELKTSNLSALEQSLTQLGDRIATMEGSSGEIEQRYTKLIQDATAAAETDKLSLEQGKEPHRTRLATALETLAAAHEQAVTDCATENAACREALDVSVEQALEAKTRAQDKVNSPRESKEAADALTKAFEKVASKTAEHNEAAAAARAADKALATARAAFTAQEDAVRLAERAIETAKLAVEAATQNLTPEPGTLKAYLKGSPDTHWHKNIARVISPDLLARKDMAPRFSEEAVSETLYGLELDTTVLETPTWCNDEFAKQQLTEAHESVTAAQSRLETTIELRKAKSAEVHAAERLADSASASATIAQQHLDAANVEVGQARAVAEAQRKNSENSAKAELVDADKRLKEARAAVSQEATRYKAALAALKTTNSENVQTAKAAFAQTIQGIDTLMAEVQSKLTKQIAELQTDWDAALTEKSIDVEKLNALKAEAVAQKDSIAEIRSKDFLVQDWKKWADEVGSAGVAQLLASATAAGDALFKHRKAVAELEGQHKLRLAEFEDQMLKSQAVTNALQEDIEIIEGLEGELSTNSTCKPVVLDENITGRDLRTRVNNDRRKRDASLKALQEAYEYVRSSLVSNDNSVRELIEGSLAEVANEDLMVRAQMLSNRYEQIAPRVIENITTTVNAQLTLVTNLSSSMERFEREVSAFNKKLSVGFNGIQRFDRISDLKVDIVTNFESLGFYAKLSNMKRVIREYRDSGMHEQFRVLPPADVVDALFDFMAALPGDGNLSVNLAAHITLRGQLTDNGTVKEFRRASELQSISSTGLSSLVLTTVLMALVNTIRGDEPVYIPFILDEVGKFDTANFHALKHMLDDNCIDLVTASPELGAVQQSMFAQIYNLRDKGRVQTFKELQRSPDRIALEAA